MTVRIGVLGPLQLWVNGTEVAVPGPKRRAALALLAMAEGRLVTTEALIDVLWPEEPPDTARATLYSHISRLRAHLGPAAGALVGGDGGYSLSAASDLAEARELLGAARAAHDAAHAAELLRAARGLWRGPVLSDLESLSARAQTLSELKREIDELALARALDAGRLDGVVADATALVDSDPLLESGVRLLVRALGAAGRATDALATAREFRRRLAAETGLDPSPALADLERTVAAGAGTARRGMPLPATGITGRGTELATVHRLLATERLVTVVGPGGVGKTRLAMEVGRRIPDATLLALAPLAEPAAIPHALAAALDLQVGRADVLAGCAALLGNGPRVLVVDNCEHLLAAARRMVETLLGACPELRILATSREPLGAGAEVALRLAPLPLPGDGDPADSPAVSVFLERARRVRPGFAPTPAELERIVGIVRRLDGMPLAIQLAAGRLSSLGLDDLHARLETSIDLLRDRSADSRHSSLRDTIRWSYDLLPEHERALFRRLAVFPDGYDLAAAESVAADLPDPAESLAHLVDASMADVDLTARPRYRMLEPVRTFALDELDAAGERAEAEARLVRWATQLAGWIGEAGFDAREPEADRMLRGELANLRAALSLALGSGLLDEAAAVVLGVSEFAGNRELPEVWAWAIDLAARPEFATHPRHPALLGMASALEWTRGDPAEAARLSRLALERADDDLSRRYAHMAAALVALSAGDFALAVEHAQAGYQFATRATDLLAVGCAAALYGGDPDTARRLNDVLGERARCPGLQAMHAYGAGEIAASAGDSEAAERHYLRSIDLARASGASFAAGVSWVGLLTLYARVGRTSDAFRGYREVIDYFAEGGFWTPLWTALRNLAQLLDEQGDHPAALFLAVAAAHAPEASVLTEPAVALVPQAVRMLEPDVQSQITASAASSGRAEALRVAREALARR